MATYSNLKSALSLRLNLGSGPDGKTRTRTVTLSRVKGCRHRRRGQGGVRRPGAPSGLSGAGSDQDRRGFRGSK